MIIISYIWLSKTSEINLYQHLDKYCSKITTEIRNKAKNVSYLVFTVFPKQKVRYLDVSALSARVFR